MARHHLQIGLFQTGFPLALVICREDAKATYHHLVILSISYKPKGAERPQMEAVGYRVIVELDKIDETQGGLIVKAVETTDREKHSRHEGVIVSMGEFAFDKYPVTWANVGDRVLFTRYAGEYVEVGDKDFRIINDLDLLSKIPPKGAEGIN